MSLSLVRWAITRRSIHISLPIKNKYTICESAKLRALRAKNVLRCQRTLRAYVLTCQRALHAYVVTRLRALRAYVPTCLACSRANVPCVLMCLTCSRAKMPCVLTCSCVSVPSSITLVYI